MKVIEAFSHREERLLDELMHAGNMEQATAACSMALEQMACELAQEEQDELVRQRQQAVMAVLRRAPQLLKGVTAKGEMVLRDAQPDAKTPKMRLGQMIKAAGAGLLAVMAVHEILDKDFLFAALQLLGGALLLYGEKADALASRMTARGIPVADAKEMVRWMRTLCQAADICVSDLALLEHGQVQQRLSGTADEAMLDLLTVLMEAKASGREALAMRSLAQAEQYLHMLGVELIAYDSEHKQLFDTLPTMGEEKTIRPAMIKDGKLLRRGVAALKQERSVGA